MYVGTGGKVSKERMNVSLSWEGDYPEKLPPCPVHPWMYVSRKIGVELCSRMKEFRTVLEVHMLVGSGNKGAGSGKVVWGSFCIGHM